MKGFYNIWAWRPSWSCDPDFEIKLSFPLPNDNSFGPLVFSNFTLVGNGNDPVQEIHNSVLGCLNEIICSLDKSLFHAAAIK